MTSFVVYPAIDMRGGNVVRLQQGDYGNETVYGDNPVSVAMAFVDAGATWVHMVDLDAAKGGDPVNRPVIGNVAAAIAGRAQLQVGGGVRSVADAQALSDLGVARVVMGSAAVRQPELVAHVTSQVGVAVAVGLDHRNGVTDISRDGMLMGADVEGLRAAANTSPLPLIASGGVGTLDDIVALLDIDNVSGVITGKAIYENRFTVEQAIDIVHKAGRS